MPQNHPWLITDTYELLGAIENIKEPASYLVDMFFSQEMPVSYSTWVSMEYRSAGRVLAPYVVKGGRGVNINRGTSRIASYKAPMVAPRRVIGLADIETRQFGETPVFSTLTPEDRAARMQAEDITDLRRMIANTKNKMASDILQTGKTTIKGYADDGRTVAVDDIDFAWNGLIRPQVAWDNAAATIFEDLRAASERIQEDTGTIPTLMVCGRNVEKYLLNNAEMFKWLSVPSRENLNMMSFTPHYTTPQARFVGYISSLNLEVVSYFETYTDDDGQVKPFIAPDTVIIGNPNRGKQLYGAITYMDMAGQWNTVAAREVPVYSFDSNAQESSLTMFSRFVLVPNLLEDHLCLKVKG